MKKSIPLKEIVGFLPYNLQCQYEGIINGYEIAKDKKEFEKENEPFANWRDYEEIEPIYGLKIGTLKQVHNLKKYWKCCIGIKGLKNFYNGNGFKPIVRPLSDLTEEITHNGETFVPSNLISKCSITGTTYNFHRINSENVFMLPYEIVKKLYEWHFDIYDWIKDGLAIDINTL